MRSADLGRHSVYTHFPQDRNCEICQRTKITRAQCRRRNGGAVPRAANFGDLITADHKVLSDNCESRNNHRYAVVVQDLATQWIQAYPCKNKTSQETQRSLQKFLEPSRKPKVIYTDNSLEFCKACEDLSWNHCTSTPHRSETNGIAERAVRRVKEGTSAVLLQSGLDEKWLANSLECYTYLRNIQDLLSDVKTPYERRFGQPFKGPIIPFGSLVEYHPITAKDQSRIHQFGKKVLLGLFLGYALYVGGRGNVEGWHNGCRHWGAGNDGLIGNLRKKTQCKGSNISPKKWKIHISSRRWTHKIRRRRSGTENIHLDTGITQFEEKSKRFSGGIRRVSTSTTSSLTSGCRWSTDWFLVHFRKLHRPPSRWTQSQTLLAERSIISCSTEIHWRLQNYADKLGCYARKPHRWLLEYRWIKRSVCFMDRFHPVYFFKWETSRRTNMVWGETDKTASEIQARSFMARTLERNVKER